MYDHLAEESRFYAKNNEALLQAMAGAQSSISAADIHALEERFDRIVLSNDISVNTDSENLPKNQNIRNSAEIINGSAVKHSLRSWSVQEQERVRKDLIKNGFDRQSADAWIADVNSAAAIVASDKARLDFEADPDQVMLKDNQEN